MHLWTNSTNHACYIYNECIFKQQCLKLMSDRLTTLLYVSKASCIEFGYCRYSSFYLTC